MAGLVNYDGLIYLANKDRLTGLANNDRLTGLANNDWLSSLSHDHFAMRSTGKIFFILLKLDYFRLLCKCLLLVYVKRRWGANFRCFCASMLKHWKFDSEASSTLVI